jgi:signal transduction histidine kinase/CheY-like chemotaxis protein
MPDPDPLFAAELPPPLPGDEQHARNEIELVGLRATVARLLEQVQRSAVQATDSAYPNELALAAAEVDTGIMPHSEFVSMLAHELRNPLQSMAMASQLLATAGHTLAAVAQAQGVFDRQIAHMSRLLDDLLDAARAASGKIVLQLAPVYLCDVIDAAIETSRPGVLQRRQQLVVDLPETPLVVSGDLVRLAQVFSNLLINASQYTDSGGSITVDAVCRGATVEITVSDNGSGIPPELQPFVFDLFTQGQRSLERAPGGLGLGLSLVRTIVRMHGGDATVFSPGAGAGSSFTVSLPLAPAAPLAPQPEPAPASASRRILIIEDNVDANEIMAMLLEMKGHRVTSSFDGADGLRLALGESFDVVLCDLGLPGLTGLEVVAAIKAADQRGAPLVIATTGYSDGAQRDLARAAGFDHYLVKPLDMPALLRAIDGHVR